MSLGVCVSVSVYVQGSQQERTSNVKRKEIILFDSHLQLGKSLLDSRFSLCCGSVSVRQCVGLTVRESDCVRCV